MVDGDRDMEHVVRNVHTRQLLGIIVVLVSRTFALDASDGGVHPIGGCRRKSESKLATIGTGSI